MNPQELANACSEHMHAHDRCAQMLGMDVIESAPGCARLSMTVRDDMVNGHTICHGGIMFTLADTAFAHACNNTNNLTVASAGSIEFIATAYPGDVLIADAHERSRGGRVGVYDVEVTRQSDQKLLAVFRGMSYQMRHAVLKEDSND
ncbi:MAG: hydroxyphenylacetyl-CoA thioesterase PaaI [Pseudomonadota bacterium]